jgi:uncharacterized iron-regulated membrane protein
VHLWAGLLTAAYVLVATTSGAALIFRQELQQLAFAAYFDIPHERSSQANAATVTSHLTAAYPGHRLLGIDWPTYRRDSFLAYLTRGSELKTVLSHPVSGRVLGELPSSSWISWLQDLHFNLLAGPRGRVVNGMGAIVTTLLCLTGIVIWWPGISRWTRALRVDLRSGWRPLAFDAHGAVGFWLFGWLLIWAVSGIEFSFPTQFKAAINAVSPLTVVRAPQSDARLRGTLPAPAPLELLAIAHAAAPDAQLARFVYPYGARSAYLVLLAGTRHGDHDTSDEIAFYFDQYSGALLARRDDERRPVTAGDRLLAWMGPLHLGTFASPGAPTIAVKAAWTILGLGFPLLVVSGLVMWWSRTRRTYLSRR